MLPALKYTVNDNNSVVPNNNSVVTKEQISVLEIELDEIETDGEMKIKATLEKIDDDKNKLNKILGSTTDFDVNAMIGLAMSGAQLAISIGSTLPVVGLAFSLVDRLIRQYQKSEELTGLLEKTQEIIVNCALMIDVTKETIDIIKKNLTLFFEDNTMTDAFKEIISKVKKYKLNPSIEIKIQTTLQKIIKILTKFDNSSDKTNFEKFKSFLSKSFQGNYYISCLKDEMASLTLYITTYNMQFVWILFLNGQHLQKISKKIDGKDVNLSDKILNEIEDTKSFENYLINDISSEYLKTISAQKGGRRRKRGKSRGKKRATRYYFRKTRKQLFHAAHKYLK